MKTGLLGVLLLVGAAAIARPHHPHPPIPQDPGSPFVIDLNDTQEELNAFFWSQVRPFFEMNGYEPHLISFRQIENRASDPASLTPFFVSFNPNSPHVISIHTLDSAGYGEYSLYGQRHSLGEIDINPSQDGDFSASFSTGQGDLLPISSISGARDAGGIWNRISVQTPPSGQGYDGYLPNFRARDPVQIKTYLDGAHFIAQAWGQQGQPGPIIGALDQGIYDHDSEGHLVLNIKATKFPVEGWRYQGQGCGEKAFVEVINFKVVLANDPPRLVSLMIQSPSPLMGTCVLEAGVMTATDAAGHSASFRARL